jgi:hypothetical protein
MSKSVGGAYLPKRSYTRTGATDTGGTYASATLSGTTAIGTGATLTTPVINSPTGVDNVVLYAADGAITLTKQIAVITKTSAACLLSIAAPGASGVGLRITIASNGAQAHVITFTGGTLWDGTTGANTTVTMTAFPGSSLTVIGASATIWLVESQNVLTSIA